MPAERLLRFPLGRETFALRLPDACYLAEVDLPAPVPLAPPEIAGLAEVRGRVVTLVDLAQLAGVEASPVPRRRALILAPPRSHLALLLPGHEVDLVVTDLSRAREQDPAGEEAATRPSRGWLTEEGLLLNLVDPEAVASLCSRRVQERFAARG
jgi:purine-binding chemotaxis protein CheW